MRGLSVVDGGGSDGVKIAVRLPVRDNYIGSGINHGSAWNGSTSELEDDFQLEHP